MRLKTYSWIREFNSAVKPYFVTIVKLELAEISTREVERLLNTRDWRTILVGSQFAGIKGMSQYTEKIGIRLGTSYAQLGVCFALAYFKNQLSVQYLCQYLDDFFASKNSDYNYYDFWSHHSLVFAFSALMWIDKNTARKKYQKYLEATKHLPKEDRNRIKLYPDKNILEKAMNFWKKWFW